MNLNMAKISNLYDGKIPANCAAHEGFYKGWLALKTDFLPKIIQVRKGGVKSFFWDILWVEF
jgi:hypothetical protein